MLRLFCTAASADWKGRPSHTLQYLGTGTRDELIQLMVEDVQKWQADQVAEDQRQYEDEMAGAEDESEEEPPGDTWEIENVRWEMKLPEQKPGDPPRETLREFAWNDDGEFSSLVYHIIDVP